MSVVFFQVVELLSGGFSDDVDSVTIIDCRYPYEYAGGHIKVSIFKRRCFETYSINISSKPCTFDIEETKYKLSNITVF